MVIATGEITRSNPLPSAAHQRHHAHAPESNLLPTSREVGVAVPDKDIEPVKIKGNPVAKSWAHFVAGGLVTSDSTISREFRAGIADSNVAPAEPEE